MVSWKTNSTSSVRMAPTLEVLFVFQQTAIPVADNRLERSFGLLERFDVVRKRVLHMGGRFAKNQVGVRAYNRARFEHRVVIIFAKRPFALKAVAEHVFAIRNRKLKGCANKVVQAVAFTQR